MPTNPTIGKKEGAEPARSGLDVDALRRGVMDKLICLQGRHPAFATPQDWYMALAYAVRDRKGYFSRGEREVFPPRGNSAQV